ncbi:MAG TPA: hypothetical protein VH855_10890 [Acetobacteraceae bacterium]|jgi:hypothetical protein
MQSPKASPNVPTGLAFEIADLMMLQGWAEFHDVQMVVELDHCVEGDEYEEVVAFYAPDSQLRRWIIWRAANEIVVQPLIGRSCRFGSVADALETLVPARS